MSDGGVPKYEPASHYDRVADSWRMLLGEELHYGVFETGDEALPVATGRLTELMIERAQLSEGLDVLDVGCGNGTPACRLATDFGVRVLGITTSAQGVADATDRSAAAGLSDLARFEVRDGTANGLPDASFDRVWVLESSHLIRERAKLFEECARILRPGGRMAWCDVIRHREIPFVEVRERRHELATLRQTYGDAHMEPLSLTGERAEAVGLVVEDLTDLTQKTLPTFEHWRQNLAANRTAVADAIGEDDAEAFGRTADILEQYWQEGILGYGIMAARKPS